MSVLRTIIVLLGIAGVIGVLASVLRTVVLPRAVPARLARLVFVSVRGLLRLRLAIGKESDYRTRDHVFALQAPIGLFAQLLIWAMLILLCFAVILWALPGGPLNGEGFVRALELSGSSMTTLGFDRPTNLVRQLATFANAGVGLTLLALVITYLPSLYNSFSRRESQITKLVVRAGSPPSGPSLLVRSWELGRFDRLEEVWDAWEDWFIDIGESHTTFPQLGFFRSPHPANHWVLAGEAVLDGVSLLMTACDVPRQSRAELCLEAGVAAFEAIAEFLGIPLRPAEGDPETTLSREKFDRAWDELTEREVPMQDDRDAAWRQFRELRARYEPLFAVLGRMTDSPRSDWSSWSEDAPRHSPPLLRLGRR